MNLDPAKNQQKKNNNPNVIRENIPKSKHSEFKKQNSVSELFTQLNNNQTSHNSLIVLEKINTRIINAIQNNTPIEPVDDIMNLISDPEMLRIGYSRIKNNKGVLTPGSTDFTDDNFTNYSLINLSNKLKKGTFIWNPVRKIDVQKPGKPEKRPLGLPDLEDKVVQSTLTIVLESIYEPIFEKNNPNYGFRAHKDPCQTIKKITHIAQGTYFAIEGDIKSASNNVDHNILIETFKKLIKDRNVLKLIRSALKSGIMEKDIKEDTLIGISQGGIVSPLLFNVYMQPFDDYITQDLLSEIESIPKAKKVSDKYERVRSTGRRATKVIKKIEEEGLKSIKPAPFFDYCKNSPYLKNILSSDSTLSGKTRKILDLEKITIFERDRATMSNWKTSYKKYIFSKLSDSELEKLSIEYFQFKKQIFKTSKQTTISIPYLESKPLKISFIRYANDWVIFNSGDYEKNLLIKQKVAEFLQNKLKLNLNMEKTTITNLFKSKVQFLGFEIYFQRNPLKKKTIKDSTQRFSSIQIFPDVKRLESKFLLKGYIDKNLSPKEVGFLTLFQDHEIIRKYNQFMIGFANYYIRNINYPSRINRWIYYLYYSCIKTLATKYRLSTKKIITKYGYKDISNSKLNFFKPNSSDLRISAKYKFNGQEKWEVLLNYNELMSRVLPLRQKHIENNDLKINIPTIDFEALYKLNFRTKTKTTSGCAICYKPSIALHHITPVRHSGGHYSGNKGFDKVVASLGRKQIPVCQTCHNNIHAGKYNGIALKDIFDIRLVAPEPVIKDETTQKSLNSNSQKSKKREFEINEKNKTFFSKSLNNYLT